MLAHAHTNSGVPDTSRSLFQFDLSAIPIGSTIQSALLSIFNDPTAYSNNGEHSTFSHSNASYIKRITQPWNEYTVTWQNQPATTSSNQVAHAATIHPHEDFTNMDVTQLVTDMVNDPENSFGFLLALQQENYYCALVFATSDNLNPQLYPQLEIYFTPPDAPFCYKIRNSAGCGGDALIWNSQVGPNNSTNYGGSTSLLAHAWTNSGVPDTSRSLIRFDLSMLSQGTNISHAKLSLFNDSLSHSFNGQHSTQSGSNESWIGGIITPWDPALVTWDSGINYSLVNAGTIPGSSVSNQHFPNLDVMLLTQDMINNPTMYFGYLIRLKSEVNYRAMVLASSDSPDGSKHPLLEVCVNDPIQKIHKNVPAINVLVYPNPANQQLNITGFFDTPVSVTIFDAPGKIVFTSSNETTDPVTIQTSMFVAGIYFLEILNAGQLFHAKILIEH